MLNQFIAGYPTELADKLKLLFAGKRPKLAEVVEASRDLLRDPKPARVLAAEEASDYETVIGDLTEEVHRLSTEVAAIAARLPADEPQARYEPSRGRRTLGYIPCYNCSGIGHFARDRPSSQRRQRRNQQQQGNFKPGSRPPTTRFQ